MTQKLTLYTLKKFINYKMTIDEEKWEMKPLIR